MKDYTRIFLALVLYMSTILMGLALFNLTGLSQSDSVPSTLRSVITILFCLGGVVLVSIKSEEKFWHSFIKCIAFSLQWFFICMALVSITMILSEGRVYLWVAVMVFSALIVYGLEKIKNLKGLNLND